MIEKKGASCKNLVFLLPTRLTQILHLFKENTERYPKWISLPGSDR